MRMKNAVRPPSPSSISQKSDEATRHARWRSPFTSRSLKTGTNAADSAESATSARTVFGMRNAISKALIGPVDAEDRGLGDLPHQADDPRDRRSRSQRSRLTGEPARRLGLRSSRATPRAPPQRPPSPAPPGRAPGPRARSAHCGRGAGRRIAVGCSAGSCATGQESSVASVCEVRRLALLAPAAVARQPPLVPLPLGVLHEGSIRTGVATIARPASCGSFTEMPNIKQQEKRVRQATRQRQENLRWRSTAKTLMRRLNEAVADGDAQETDGAPPRARPVARPGCGERRAPPEHRRSTQVAGGEARRRRSGEVSPLSWRARRAGA